MLINILKNYNFTEKEAKVYVACLELGNAIVSSISRHAGEHRITTYSILKDLKSRGIANEITKNKVKYFSVISPEQLLQNEEKKLEKLKKVMPELLALSNLYGNKPKVYYYEGFERLKELFMNIVEEGNNMNSPYLSFAGTMNIDKEFKKFLEGDFIKVREKVKITTKVIISDIEDNYNRYHKKNYDHIIINDPIFEMGNEIVLYGENKVAILNYATGEIYGLAIESKTLFTSLKSMFNLIWKAYNK